MRFAVLIKATTLHKDFGGLETQNKTLCEGLARLGHRVVVFTPARELKIDQEEENGVSYRFIPCTYRMLLASVDPANWYNKSYATFLQEHRKEAFDVVISQSSAGIGIIKRKKSLGVKIVGIAHGTIGGEMQTVLNSGTGLPYLVKHIPALAYGAVNFFGRQRDYIHGCDRIAVVSTAVKASIINETHCDQTKVTVIHNGLDPALIPQKDWAAKTYQEPVKIIYAGRIEESKGLKELILACQGIPGIFLNIIGDGPILEDLKRLSRDLKMSQKILFYGRLPHEKVLELYACCDLFVLPTKRLEGLPMTLVEASFAGLPIIATDIGGNKDVVENGVNGLLIKDARPETITKAIADLLANRASMPQMGMNGKIKADKHFTLNKMLSDYEKLCTF